MAPRTPARLVLRGLQAAAQSLNGGSDAGPAGLGRCCSSLLAVPRQPTMGTAIAQQHPQTAALSSWAAAGARAHSTALQPWRACTPLLAAAAACASHATGWRGVTSSAGAYSQCDCPTLGGPPPDMVVVEYDEDEVDRFIALADAIEEALPNVVVEGNPSGPGRPGSFEVATGSGSLLFSRMASGAWPAADAVVTAISSSAAAAAAEAACALPTGGAAAAAGAGAAAAVGGGP